MEYEIKVKAPEGKKPVYDEKSQTITFVPIDVKDVIKSYDDACTYLRRNEVLPADSQLRAIVKLRTILDALNGDHKFNLAKGDAWYPWVRFYEKCELPECIKDNIIGEFTLLNGEDYFLVGGYANYCGNTGIGCFHSSGGVGYASADIGLFACKDRETAMYVSSQFGNLIFQAIYRHLVPYVLTSYKNV
mgnify:CR=1 FL=1